jgi:hypothetical protein
MNYDEDEAMGDAIAPRCSEQLIVRSHPGMSHAHARWALVCSLVLSPRLLTGYQHPSPVGIGAPAAT